MNVEIVSPRLRSAVCFIREIFEEVLLKFLKFEKRHDEKNGDGRF